MIVRMPVPGSNNINNFAKIMITICNDQNSKDLKLDQLEINSPFQDSEIDKDYALEGLEEDDPQRISIDSTPDKQENVPPEKLPNVTSRKHRRRTISKKQASQ